MNLIDWVTALPDNFKKYLSEIVGISIYTGIQVSFIIVLIGMLLRMLGLRQEGGTVCKYGLALQIIAQIFRIAYGR